MEPEDRPDLEVLDTGRPPSAFHQWASRALQRRAVKAGLAVVVALAVAGVWSTLPSEEPPAAADAEPVATAEPSPGLRPPSARGRESATGTWQVANDLAIRSGPRGHTVTFTATNRGPEAQDPSQLEVTGAFVDRSGLTYRATCSRAERTPRGYRAIAGSVRPTRTVLVRCRDVTRYGGRTALIDPSSVDVHRIPWYGDSWPRIPSESESEDTSVPIRASSGGRSVRQP